MNSHEFFLWLNGYLEALESEGIKECKIESIRKKMAEVKTRPQGERVVFGPNVRQGSIHSPQQTPQSYANNPPK